MFQTYRKPQWIVSRPIWSIEGPFSSCLLSSWSPYSSSCEGLTEPFSPPTQKKTKSSKCGVFGMRKACFLSRQLRSFLSDSLSSLIRLVLANQEGRNHGSDYKLHRGLRMLLPPATRNIFGSKYLLFNEQSWFDFRFYCFAAWISLAEAVESYRT